ncbi:two-component response regulator-like APRR5-like isoform X1 [Hibiscus syriacus]|uniref:Two-component response regulator-like APRR5-like isoform X1 n=1 Tax=Hibiscus syriacus TaxID=106335 RepID=A0A6A2ZQW3_HIBSY|nr:NDR1/HIN1-like protein 26 [Hibiscus syriacus]KAE8694294.1 two-component response regulator-like APRR5-like isoform X1 [Hibiscus syriacus]
MSQVLSKSPKHCAEKQSFPISKFYKKLFFVFSSCFTIVLTFIFLIWLTLHPSKPHFSLTQADIYQLNLTRPSLLNSSIQLTFLSNNPNNRVGIYYDELQAYASYKGQQITMDTPIPPFYQGHEESNLLTVVLQGNGFPVAPSFGYEVGRDQSVGRMVLSFKVIGKLRWKVGSWVSGRYRFNVNCVSVVAFGPGAVPTSPFIGSSRGTQCSTDV